MRSYALVEFGEPFQAIERPDPTPQGMEVLLRVRRAGVCHSDVHIRHGYFDMGDGVKFHMADRGMKPPITLGHEVFGEIVAVGDAVRDSDDAPIGASRLLFPWLGCGACARCDDERDNDCMAMRAIGVLQDGGYATHVLAPHSKYLVDIGDLDPNVATPYACSGLTVFSALKKAAPIADDEWLAIFGAGGLGLTAIAIAKAMGVAQVVAIDIDQAKLDAARAIGANAAMTSDEGRERLAAITGGALVGTVDTVGTPSTAALAIGATTKTGRYVSVGLHGGAAKLSMPYLAQRALTVRGSYVGSLGELKELIALAKTGAIKPIPVSTRPLEEASRTLDDLEAGKIVGRVVLTTE